MQENEQNKIWYLFIGDQQEGPYSCLELSKDRRLTPETLAWREGMADWLPISNIFELAFLFDKEKKDSEKDEEELEEPHLIPDEELVLDLYKGGPNPLIWIILALLIFSYLLYEYLWVH